MLTSVATKKRACNTFYDLHRLQLRHSSFSLQRTQNSILYSNRSCALSSGASRKCKTDCQPSISKLVVPVKVRHNPSDINVGNELTGKLNREAIVNAISKFYQREQVKIAAAESGLDSNREFKQKLCNKKNNRENYLQIIPFIRRISAFEDSAWTSIACRSTCT